MGVRETWNDLGTGVKVLLGLGAAFVALVIVVLVVVPLLVVLAAVIGSVALGLGDQPPDAPQASFEIEYDSASMTAEITHAGGETITADRLVVSVDSRRVRWTDDDGEVTAGDAMTVEVQPGDTVRVVYEGEETTQVLADEEVTA